MMISVEMERGWMPGTVASLSREDQASVLGHWLARHRKREQT